MNRMLALLDRIHLRWVLLFTLAVLVPVVMMVAGSLRGIPESRVRFEVPIETALPAEAPIAAWISHDRDSYVLGEQAISRVRILYRPAMATPDIEAFRRNLGFLPFDQTGLQETVRDVGGGVTEYLLEYRLHIVGVRKPDNYRFNPVMLFYSSPAEPGSDLRSIRIPRPDLRVGSLYPWNVAAVPLRELRGQMDDLSLQRRTGMLVTALLMLAIAGLLVWRYGRRRPVTELSEPEQLWNQYRALDRGQSGNRRYLFACEHIVTRLLHIRTGIDPETFWAGAVPEDAAWHSVVIQARQILGSLYRPGEIADSDVQGLDTLVSGLLESLVEQQRLQIEQQPSLLDRLARQRHATTVIVATLILSLVSLVLSVRTDWWLAPEQKQYNDYVARIRSSADHDEDLLLELQAFAASAQNPAIRTAAYHNSGTLRAQNAFADMPAATQRQMLGLVFEAESADALLETLLLAELAPSEEDVIRMLVGAAENLLQAELDLQNASRTDAGRNEDVLRNLELVTRWRHAILTRLVQLRDLFKMAPGEVADEDIISDQGLVNIIEAKLPEEYEEAEMAKDDSSYIIFERF